MNDAYYLFRTHQYPECIDACARLLQKNPFDQVCTQKFISHQSAWQLSIKAHAQLPPNTLLCKNIEIPSDIQECAKSPLAKVRRARFF